MRTTCSRNDYMSLSEDEQRALASDFLSLTQRKYPDKEFGHDSFPELSYDHMVLSTLFHDLKETCKTASTGYTVFRLAKQTERFL